MSRPSSKVKLRSKSTSPADSGKKASDVPKNEQKDDANERIKEVKLQKKKEKQKRKKEKKERKKLAKQLRREKKKRKRAEKRATQRRYTDEINHLLTSLVKSKKSAPANQGPTVVILKEGGVVATPVGAQAPSGTGVINDSEAIPGTSAALRAENALAAATEGGSLMRARKIDPKGKAANAEQNGLISGEEPGPDGDDWEYVPDLYPDWESTYSGEFVVHDSNAYVRDKWTNTFHSVIASVSASVGIGNFLGFPFTMYRHGGGAFIVPFGITVLAIMIPLSIFELGLGQFASRGPVGVWDMAPILRGTGFATVGIVSCSAILYVYTTSITIIYMIESLAAQDVVEPWAECNPKYYVTKGRRIFQNFSCIKDPNKKNNDTIGFFHYKDQKGQVQNKTVNTADLYYRYSVLKAYDNLDQGTGPPDLRLVVSLIASWFLVWLNIMWGTKVFGKLAIFFGIFPYIIIFSAIFIFLVGDTDGVVKASRDGVRLLFEGQWDKLSVFDTWYTAFLEGVHGVAIGYGPVIMYGSFNHPKSRSINEAIFSTLADVFSSIICGILIFSFIGVSAYLHGVDLKKYVASVTGNDFAFSVFVQAVTGFDEPKRSITEILFYLNCAVLAMGPACAYVQVVSYTVLDFFPKLNVKRSRKIMTFGAVCAFFACISIVLTTPGGPHLIPLIKFYGNLLLIGVVVMFEIAGVAYVYGFKSFILDLRFTFQILSHEKLLDTMFLIYEMYGYLIPPILAVIFGNFFYKTLRNTSTINLHGVFQFEYPQQYIAFSWVLATAIFICIPSNALIVFMTRSSRSVYKRWMASIMPNPDWGPKETEARVEWILFKSDQDDRTWLHKKIYGTNRITPAEWTEQMKERKRAAAAASADSLSRRGSKGPSAATSNKDLSAVPVNDSVAGAEKAALATKTAALPLPMTTSSKTASSITTQVQEQTPKS